MVTQPAEAGCPLRLARDFSPARMPYSLPRVGFQTPGYTDFERASARSSIGAWSSETREPHRQQSGEALLGSAPFSLTHLALPPRVGRSLRLLRDYQVDGPGSARVLLDGEVYLVALI